MSRHHVAQRESPPSPVVAGLVPAGASAQNVIIPPAAMSSRAARDRRGAPSSRWEAALAFAFSKGLTVGVVLPAPEQVPPDFDVREIVGALLPGPPSSVTGHGWSCATASPPARQRASTGSWTTSLRAS